MSNEILALSKSFEKQMDDLRSRVESSLVHIIDRVESESASTKSYLAEFHQRMEELLDRLSREGKTQRSDAAHKFEKIAAHSVTQRLEANLALLDYGREIQAIREDIRKGQEEAITFMEGTISLMRAVRQLQDRSACDLDLLKLDVEFIRNHLKQ